MAVFDNLLKVQDQRKGDDSCYFNGYLEDYLASHEDFEYHELFSEILEQDSQFRICTGLGFNVNKEVISNQIIRYKDAGKLPDKAIRCPFILYVKSDEMQKGIIMTEGNQYLLAKGYYYCLTEQYAVLEDSRNEIIAVSLDNPRMVAEKVTKFLRRDSRAGAIQREIDNYYFKNVAEMIELAQKTAVDIREKAVSDLLELEDRADYIYKSIAKWYLLKKVVYVSYMMNKDILRNECEGEIKKQRYNAKTFADKIPFMALSEMWRLKEQAEESEASRAPEAEIEPQTEETTETE